METPICDFVRRYGESQTLRAHMPGHKGVGMLGFEHLDITEIAGADSLYEADGIIRQSEENAGALFGCPTFYSTEGSSQCIRAMLFLAMQDAKRQGRTPKIAAARNVHKTFLNGAALLDLDVVWLYPQEDHSYLSCPLDGAALGVFLEREQPTAVYVTSPDYLGYVAPIEELAAVCHAHDALLLVDNAHGAYLRFLEPSRHPMDLGADLCCDSAHKTLPVLTGGAYLHGTARFAGQAKNALALFGSTSPSYLILQSLDGANAYLETHGERLSTFLPQVGALKTALRAEGYGLYGEEPLKITIAAKGYGYTGTELSDLLRKHGIECEFADPDFLVLMLTPETEAQGLEKIRDALLSIPKRSPVRQAPPSFRAGVRAMSIREAMFSVGTTVPIEESKGWILAAASVGCPPAVPILVCGERIDEHTMRCFQYYGIDAVTVVEEMHHE